MTTTPRTHALFGAIAAALVCALLLIATSRWQPLGWDEGDTILRAETLRAAVAPAGDLDRPSLSAAWPFTTVREGHPPLAGIVVALGMSLAPAALDPMTAARLGPMLLFSIAVGALCYRLHRDYNVWIVSLAALAALVTMPRVFAHAHFATLDGPLCACWTLAWATFEPARRGGWARIGFGLVLGLTLCAKFSGWLAPLPFVAWALVYRDRGALRALAVGIPLALAVFVALNPPLWEQPLGGLRTFFDLNLHRQAQYNISTQFFGSMYNLDHPLPWYNALVWTAITISPMPLLFGWLGVYNSVRRWRSDRASLLLVLEWGTLILARATPWAPPHDAERLILPSFVFFAALIGVGVGRALYRDSLLETEKIIPQGWAKVAGTIALVAASVDAIGYFPHGLSYYNRLVGGLRGAVTLGMEPTYYWDALDRRALAWLAENTGPDEKIAFAAAPPKNLELLKRWGLLARLPDEPGRFRWYVLQRRPSAWQPADRWLIEHKQPALERSLSGVPLLDVYSYDDYQQALAATKGDSPGSAAPATQ